jgi:hypothetical protein
MKVKPSELNIRCPVCDYDYSMNDGILVDIPEGNIFIIESMLCGPDNPM